MDLNILSDHDHCITTPFWGQVFSHQGSGLSSTCLFGAKFSAVKTQVCHRLAFLGPCFQSSRFNFVVESPCLFVPPINPIFWKNRIYWHRSDLLKKLYWRMARGAPLSGTRFSATKTQICCRIAFFGARFSAVKTQVCHRLAFLGPCFQSSRFNFVTQKSAYYKLRR